MSSVTDQNIEVRINGDIVRIMPKNDVQHNIARWNEFCAEGFCCILLFSWNWFPWSITVDACASRTFLEAQYRWTTWESRKIVSNNPPNCDDSTSASLDDRVVILNRIQTSFDARWSLADFCAFTERPHAVRKKKQIVSPHFYELIDWSKDWSWNQ